MAIRVWLRPTENSALKFANNPIHGSGDVKRIPNGQSIVAATFWQFTLTTLVLGWWGLISFIVTPFFILNNVFRYMFCLGLESVPPGAVQPVLTEEVVERLQPLTDELIEQLNSGDDFKRVVENVAMKARATKGQVALYVHALVAASQGADQ